MQDDQWYVNRQTRMIEDDRLLRVKLLAMNDMYHAIWASPAPKVNVFWRDIKSATPHNIVKAVTQMYASVSPKIKLMPTAPNPETKARANQVERALTWQYRQAEKRNGNVTRDIMFNTVLYGRACAQVIYLPWQNKIAKDLDARKWDLPGDFAINVHNPVDVHVLTSSLGLEAVLLVKDVTVSELVALWGRAVSKQLLEQYSEGRVETVRLYDWTDHEDRVVRVTPTGNNRTPITGSASTASSAATTDGMTIFKEPHKLPFLNWSVKSVGANAFAESQHQVEPLLDSLYIAGQYDNLNIMESGMYSHLLSTFFAPGGVSKTASGEAPTIDYKNPEGIINLELEDSYQPIPKPQFDERMATFSQKLKNEIGEGTIPPLLQGGATPSGAAYATINQLYKASESKTEDFKQCGQDVLTDAHVMMLRWYIHVHKNLTGYDTTKKGLGEAIVIDYRTLDPKNLYLTAELTAAKPIDKLQELNGGLLMKNLGSIPMETILEELGYENPEELIKQAFYEQLQAASHGKRMTKIQAEGQAEAQKIMLAAQPQPQPPTGQQGAGGPPQQEQPQGQIDPAALQQQAAGRAAAGIPPEQQTGALSALMAQGQGMNPAQGSISPTELAPGQVTKENVTQRDRKGGRVK